MAAVPMPSLLQPEETIHHTTILPHPPNSNLSKLVINKTIIMYHLFSIIATLSVVSAIPLPQFDLPTSLDFVISEPTTSIDTANADTYFPTAPFLISEQIAPPPSKPAPGPGLDTSWTGKDREPTYGDNSGMGPPIPKGSGDPPSPGWVRGWPATPNQDGSHYYQRPPPPGPLKDGEDGPAPEPNSNDAGIAGAATSVIKGVIDNLPPGLNPSPAGGY